MADQDQKARSHPGYADMEVEDAGEEPLDEDYSDQPGDFGNYLQGGAFDRGAVLREQLMANAGFLLVSRPSERADADNVVATSAAFTGDTASVFMVSDSEVDSTVLTEIGSALDDFIRAVHFDLTGDS